MKTLPLNLIHRFLLVCMLTLAVSPVFSQDSLSAETPGKVKLRYAGTQDEHLVFYVQVNNDAREHYRFLIRDENNNVLFEENFNQQAFEKKILLEKTGMNNVSFEISGRNYVYRRQFAIETRTIEQVTVSEKAR